MENITVNGQSVYTPLPGTEEPLVRGSQEQEPKICAICIQPIISPEDEKILHSNHSFHIVCVNNWLERQRTCPLCREYISRPESQRNAAIKLWISAIYISHFITMLLGVISLVIGYTDISNFNDECENRACLNYSLFIRATAGYSFSIYTITLIWIAISRPRNRDILKFLAILSVITGSFFVTGLSLVEDPGFPEYCSPNCSEILWHSNIIWGITMLFSGLPFIPGIVGICIVSEE